MRISKEAESDLQQTISTLEKEGQLNRIFEEYSGRIESFSQMLDLLREAAIVINADSEIQYANSQGQLCLQDELLKKKLGNALIYRTVHTEFVEVKNDAHEEITIRINAITWNAEPANLLVLEKRDVFRTENVSYSPIPETKSVDPVQAMLNYVQNIAEHNTGYDSSIPVKSSVEMFKRLEKLLPGIKAFVGLSERATVLNVVSIKAVVSRVLEDLKTQIELSGAELNIAELPDAFADKELVYDIFRQLLENAIRFRKSNKRPVIDIGYDINDGNAIFCVRDNGIGISKKDHQRIFKPFETLEAEDASGGSGLGLSICKKMVDAQGGEIWVESLPGMGSNFYFTLKSA